VRVIAQEGGDSASGLYNFFIGRELNPRVGGSFDVKFFCELRPGLIGWVALNAAMAAKQFELNNHSYVSPSMLLVLSFQVLLILLCLHLSVALHYIMC